MKNARNKYYTAYADYLLACDRWGEFSAQANRFHKRAYRYYEQVYGIK